MNVKKKILFAMGTRPEIIKMAPLYHGLKEHGVTPLIMHTGQHKELAYPLYEFFKMKPDFVINLDREKFLNDNKTNDNKNTPFDLPQLSALLINKIATILYKAKPDMVVVHGDTISAAMAAWAAYSYQIDVAHVEAGLRSFDKYHPFQEEVDRSVIARIAERHFLPPP